MKVACKWKGLFNCLLCSAIRWCHLKFQIFTFPVLFCSKGMGWDGRDHKEVYSSLLLRALCFLACHIILGRPEIISNTLVCSDCIMGSCTAWWLPERPVLVSMGLWVTLWSGKEKTGIFYDTFITAFPDF